MWEDIVESAIVREEIEVLTSDRFPESMVNFWVNFTSRYGDELKYRL